MGLRKVSKMLVVEDVWLTIAQDPWRFAAGPCPDGGLGRGVEDEQEREDDEQGVLQDSTR